MKLKLIRVLCLILALLCVLPLFAGCASKEKAVKTKLTNVFKGEEFTLPIDVENIYNMMYSNGRIYAMTNKGYEGEDGAWNNTYTVFSVKEDGTDYKEEISLSGNNTGINNILVNPNGEIWITQNIYNYDNETGESTNEFYLKKYADGKEVSKIDVMSLFPGNDNVYFNNIYCDANGRMYTSMDHYAVIINPDGSLAGTIDFGANYVNSVLIDSSDNVYAIYYDQAAGNTIVAKLDINAMTIGEKVESTVFTQYSYSLRKAPVGSDYDFYFNDNSGIYGYNTTSDITTELCNWIASDINGSNVSSFCVIDDEHIVSMSYNYDNTMGSSSNSFELLTRVPDDQVTEKYVLTLACIYCDYDLRNAVLDFNKKSDDYKIMIKEYSSSVSSGNLMTSMASSTVAPSVDYSDYDSMITALNNDIIAGNIPDIIQLDSNMPINSYISKGLFADLYDFIDSDPEIKRDDYLTNILSAFETNGKLYELVPSFSVQTVAGKKSIVGDITGWNMDEFNKVLAAHTDAIPFNDMTRDQLLQYMCTYTADQFVDRHTGLCTFDSDGFKKVLEFAKNLSTESMWENFNWEDVDQDFWNQMETACRDGRVLLEIEYISSYRGYWQVMKGTFGDDIALVGFPTDSRNGSAINPAIELAISAKSSMSEGAWQFLRYFLTDDYQNTLTYNFPIKLSRLNDMAAEQMKPQVYKDYQGNEVTQDSTWYIGGEEIKIGEITREYVETVNNFIKSLTMVYRYDTDMIDIIKEEAAAYFAGSKTLDETVKIIQNRVSIYINESR